MAVTSRCAHTRRPLKPGTARHSLLDVDATLARTAEDWRSSREVLVNAITTIGTATTAATIADTTSSFLPMTTSQERLSHYVPGTERRGGPRVTRRPRRARA